MRARTNDLKVALSEVVTKQLGTHFDWGHISTSDTPEGNLALVFEGLELDPNDTGYYRPRQRTFKVDLNVRTVVSVEYDSDGFAVNMEITDTLPDFPGLVEYENVGEITVHTTVETLIPATLEVEARSADEIDERFLEASEYHDEIYDQVDSEFRGLWLNDYDIESTAFESINVRAL